MKFQLLPMGDPRIARRHLSAIFFGPSGAGKTRCALEAFPTACLVDANGTAGRHAQYTDAKVIVDASIEALDWIINCIKQQAKNQQRVPDALIVDGFNRIIGQIESDLSTLSRDAYYRGFRDRLDTLMWRLLDLPCHIIIITNERQIKAKAGEVVGGILVGPNENVVIDVAPDIPAQIEPFVDLTIHFHADLAANETEAQLNRRATIRRSLFDDALPAATCFGDPLTQLPPIFHAIGSKLLVTFNEAATTPTQNANQPTAPVITPVSDDQRNSPRADAPGILALPPGQPLPEQQAAVQSVADEPVVTITALQLLLSDLRDLGVTKAGNLKDYLVGEGVWDGSSIENRRRYEAHMIMRRTEAESALTPSTSNNSIPHVPVQSNAEHGGAPPVHRRKFGTPAHAA